MKIGFCGLGKLGLPVAVAIAQKFPVIGYDINPKLRCFRLYEHREAGPDGKDDFQNYFQSVCTDTLGSPSGLGFADTLKEAVSGSDIIFVAVQTPHQPQFDGSTRLPLERADFDYSYLIQAVKDIAAYVRPEQTVTVISTVLPGTMRKHILPILKGKCKFAYNPFFIAMGTVMQDFMNPEFVLIGEEEGNSNVLVNFYRKLYGFYDSPMHPDKECQVPIQRMSIESAELTKVAYNCYSGDTEVMTSVGWKLFRDLDGEEEILSLNPSTIKAEWTRHTPVPPNDGYKELIRFSNTKTDILVTPSHNMYAGLFQPRKPGPKSGGYLRRGTPRVEIKETRYKWAFIPADVLEAKPNRQLPQYLFRRSVGWSGTDNPEVVIASKIIPIKVFARFMGWYLAEGCVSQHSHASWSVTVAQSKNPVNGRSGWQKCKQSVADFCKSVEVEFSESDMSFTFYDRHIAQYLSQFGHAKHKWVPETIKEANTEIIEEFLGAYMEGDGCDTENGTYYATTSDRMASDLGELIVKVGKMPSYRTAISPKSGRPCHLIYPTFSKFSGTHKIERIPYSGNVYCTQLSKNNVMLVRRNGKCAWCGNTFITSKIRIANTIMEICHKVDGCNVDDVTNTLAKATDRLISPKYLKGSAEDGGACHPRDCIAMSWLSQQLDLSSDLFEDLMLARDLRTEWLAQLILDESFKRNLPICILGKAFKAETNIVAGSFAVLLANILKEANVEFTQYDPYVDTNYDSDYPIFHGGPRLYFVATNHTFFANQQLPKGSVVLDLWRYLKPQEGVTIIPIGVGSVNSGCE